MLKEIEVVAKEVVKEDNLNHYYSNPDWSHKVTEKDLNNRDALSFLQGRVGGLLITNGIGFGSRNGDYLIKIRGGRNIMFLLDNRPIDQETFRNIQMVNIDRIDVQKNCSGVDGIISIFSKKDGGFYRPKTDNSINKIIDGFYEARVFYAPQYEKQSIENAKPDLRTTIFWQPVVITDNEGKATITFYNDDKTTSVNVKAEGITEKGNLVVVKASYVVK